MIKRLRERTLISGCAFALLLVLAAVSPRPAVPAVPARPVAQEELPLAGVTICVDAGHGGADGGARARDSGTWEKEINLSVAGKVKSALEALGAETVMTRTDGQTFSDNKREDIGMRMAAATDAGADILLSIHMNEYRTRRESGPQVFYRFGQEDSRLLAGALQSELISALKPAKERVAMAGDYYILSLDIPSVLIECGFISNAAEEKLLLSDAYQQKLADAVAAGTAEYWALRARGARPAVTAAPAKDEK